MYDSPSLPASIATDDADSIFRRVALRFMPLLFVSYVVAYLDRVNVGFAKLQMLNSLHLSEAVYGLGAGLFFVGYFFSRYRATFCCIASARGAGSRGS